MCRLSAPSDLSGAPPSAAGRRSGSARGASWLGALALAGLGACSPGPGRQPFVEHSAEEVSIDAGLDDTLGRPDVGPLEVGDVAIGVTDFGPPPRFPFTGIFSAFGTSSPLYAREIDGRLVLLFGTPPYIYVGSIDAEGQVITRSLVLERSGCPGATLVGQYGRASATFELDHVSCSLSGERIRSTVRGGFASDFVPAQSGVYEGRIAAWRDPLRCGRGLPLGSLLRWGLNVLPDGRAMVITAIDPLPEPLIYLGRLSRGGLALIATVSEGPEPQGVAFQGSALPGVEGQRATLSGQRDAWRPNGLGGCTFSMDVALERVSSP